MISKTMAVAAALEAKVLSAKIAAKKGSLDDLINDETSSNGKPETGEKVTMPAIGMIKKRAHWGGSVMVEYSFEESETLMRKDVFPPVFDAVNTNFSEPCSYQVQGKGEFVVCKFRDFDYTQENAQDAIDEMPYYVVVVERQRHAQWPEDEIFLTRLAQIAQQTFDCVRGREHRKNARKTAISNVKQVRINSPSALHFQFIAVN